MRFRYELYPKAQQEYENAVEWYANRSFPTAEKFVDEVDSAFATICEFPHRWKNEYAHYYEYYLKRFPFTIVYSIHAASNSIFILSIFHQRRNPKKRYK